MTDKEVGELWAIYFPLAEEGPPDYDAEAVCSLISKLVQERTDYYMIQGPIMSTQKECKKEALANFGIPEEVLKSDFFYDRRKD